MRLNIDEEGELDWLSLRPSQINFMSSDKFENKSFGELNSSNNLNGRGLYLDSSGSFEIGYFADGDSSTPGGYLAIRRDGGFLIGENYLDGNGDLKNRGTRFKPNGSASKYGY